MDEVVERLQAYLLRYAIPFTFGTASDSSGEFDLKGGLCVAVDLGDERFVVTAGHVVAAMARARVSSNARCFLGHREIPFVEDNISIDDAVDIGTIRVSGDVIEDLKSHYQIVRPITWPPPETERGDGVIIIGAPRAWRSRRSPNHLEIGLITIAAPVTQVNDDNLVCQMDPEKAHEYQIDTQHSEPAGEFSGSSGGPVFLPLEQRGIVVHHLCAIVREEVIISGTRFVYLSRLSRIGTDGRIAGE